MTNEESRKNWEEYGNPDGPGGELVVIMNFAVATLLEICPHFAELTFRICFGTMDDAD